MGILVRPDDSSDPVAPTVFQKNPFGENVEWLFHCGNQSEYGRCLADAGTILSVRPGSIIARSVSNRRAFRFFEGVADVASGQPKRCR